MASCVARIFPVRLIFAPPTSLHPPLHRRICPLVFASHRSNSSAVKLAEVGKFEEPKIGKYATGQLFLHRIFGYRGVILFPWLARVFDRDLVNRKDVIKPVTESISEKSTTSTASSSTESAPQFHNIGTGRDVKGRTVPYYQVLIDSRDCPYVRAQTEAVTFLGHQSETSRSLYAIPGLDYISHEDVLPYVSVERSPIFHELFDKFLHFDAAKGQFEGKETLLAWQDRNHPWLELSDVHRETTENIRVTVIPFYMGCKKDTGQGGSQSIYWWRYCIRLENLGEEMLQLRERHWRIFSLSGTLETVRGRGVVGQEPVLSKTLPAFQYSSHVSLQAPSGHMWGYVGHLGGRQTKRTRWLCQLAHASSLEQWRRAPLWMTVFTFRFEKDDGSSVDVKIPPFSLESKDDESTTYTVT